MRARTVHTLPLQTKSKVVALSVRDRRRDNFVYKSSKIAATRSDDDAEYSKRIIAS